MHAARPAGQPCCCPLAPQTCNRCARRVQCSVRRDGAAASRRCGLCQLRPQDTGCPCRLSCGRRVCQPRVIRRPVHTSARGSAGMCVHAMGRMATGNDTRLRRGVPAHTWACQQHTSALQPPVPRPALPQVALVGYTNAGKSSLMAAVAKHSGVAAEDRLFATLDPTLRCAGLHAGLAQHAGAGAAGVGLKQPAQSSSCWARAPPVAVAGAAGACGCRAQGATSSCLTRWASSLTCRTSWLRPSRWGPRVSGRVFVCGCVTWVFSSIARTRALGFLEQLASHPDLLQQARII